jgi:hypothetical protein
VLAVSTTDPRLKWLAEHCKVVSPTLYFCRRSDA